MLIQTDVKHVAESIPGARVSFGRTRNWNRWLAILLHCCQKRLTFGTTSLNQGSVDRSSANQSAVAEPTSLDRLWISHSFVHVKYASGEGDVGIIEVLPWKCTPASG